ncbi:hypothetical protein [Pseudobacteriovorax antillogorgiicola]|uniref:Uncharacterized protein n=1 Tax=Pseudobacteriovorax antillogorgiicola TaxID=1513793 RepID=A0A1Y6BG00_9BACT|nr:hypothetical protein [Pseudobacteriovorax antillogorgiicola]TCS57363.1 hypothetical protein EDD56_103103 [Pseudobacteriovorax antillogorgiicola]SMF01984.1 hypothetical protein SAMN06296036_103230 [Pseudobacteriovorax antillogorgiicola]
MFRKALIVSLAGVLPIACQNDDSGDHGPAKNREAVSVPGAALVSTTYETNTYDESVANPISFSLPLGGVLLGDPDVIKADLKKMIAFQKKVESDGETEEVKYKTLSDDLFEVSLDKEVLLIKIARQDLDWSAGDYRLVLNGTKLGSKHYYPASSEGQTVEFKVEALDRYMLNLEPVSEEVALSVKDAILLTKAEREKADEAHEIYAEDMETKKTIEILANKLQTNQTKLDAEDDKKKKEKLEKEKKTLLSELANAVNRVSNLATCGEKKCADRKSVGSEDKDLLTKALEALTQVRTLLREQEKLAYHTISYKLADVALEDQDQGLPLLKLEDGKTLDYEIVYMILDKMAMKYPKGDKSLVVNRANILPDFDRETGDILFHIKKTWAHKQYEANKGEVLGSVQVNLDEASNLLDLDLGFSVGENDTVLIKVEK